ncbi:M23 family metallopeptidase [Candidatus Ponderosibacter sp. Uisw_141_02]|uniref:M23 family metallopeptidase n=1 Tax=Candidatus Ponderosibacter sp. Uisw_141_02 TaxID=3231000 RepID=UPI003D5AF8FC
MTNKGQKAVTPRVVRVLRALGLAGLYARFAPEVRRGNQPDMPIITTNKIWFLRENRFLVFTRGGPVEVTLKPSLVLTGILICMAGVAAIFYSTIIASYSAIEVMRDETIKTAQASANPKGGAAFNKDDTATSALKWFDYDPASLEDSHPPSIIGKIAQPPSLIVGRITTQLAVTTPQTQQTSPNTKIAEDAETVADNAMPMIIQGGKRVTLASNAASANPEFGNDANNMAIKQKANDASSPEMVPMTAEPSLADQKSIETTASVVRRMPKIDAEQANAVKVGTNVTAASNPIIENNVKPASIAARAQEFAIALLPNFASAPNERKPAQIQPDENNGDAIETARLSPPSPNLPEQPAAKNAALPAAPDMPQADGLLTGFFTQRRGPVLPLVTEAARTKKMLLALEQEIDYIRATVTGLGISADVLPSQIQLASMPKDDDFKNMMVNLAEHRAALRKIPFKPPMLYYYISSDYGNRKHPKTGKVSFHHGVDLAGTWQENVRVTAPGTVIYAGTEGSFGKVVRVQHDFGIVTTYAHLARITVRLDDYIGENHVIGKMGNTGRSAGAHLHYEVRVNDKSIDPVKFMTVGRQISVAGELRQSSLVE